MNRVRAGLFGAVACAMVLGSLPATAADFSSRFGFEEAGLEGLPVSKTIDASDLFLMAGEAGAGSFAVDLTGSTEICLFTNASPTCQADTSGINGAYSVFLTIQVAAINDPRVTGPFHLVLSGLMGDSYGESEVSVDLDSTVPAGLDTSGIAGFNPRSFSRVIDESPSGSDFNYVGWTVQLGDTVSFRYDVANAPGIRSVPQLSANVVVPEPGTALLMGLGLAGLASRSRRETGASV